MAAKEMHKVGIIVVLCGQLAQERQRIHSHAGAWERSNYKQNISSVVTNPAVLRLESRHSGRNDGDSAPKPLSP